ncbi:phosphopantothenoylcysteine decarboxylase isoform X5 [Piliocolobus tephrosceles]|uniref:phosphopantothenoylcysteine decarboxylase isoform X5 n=1 Tax=Piliocolobus tephrosceles TaxID=591936 RepID=UPI000C2A95EA|nr:phosphopantothenoylcysteine decarboxylase isoform X5 [Piliocolobus tephrosceles]
MQPLTSRDGHSEQPRHLILNPDSFMEPRPGRLLELEATRPHMEPKASCPTAAPLVERKFHVLVGVTGSVAALKSPLLVSKLLDIPGLEVAVVTTERAKHFYSPQDIPVTLYSDADEWETCVIRAWDRSKPLLFCPAMNTAMWEHPITAQQVDQLKAFGYVEIPCVAKKLVCGDEECVQAKSVKMDVGKIGGFPYLLNGGPALSLPRGRDCSRLYWTEGPGLSFFQPREAAA